MENAFCEICKEESMRFKFEREGGRYFRCGRCGLEKIYPQPDASQLSRIYDGHYYDAWGAWQKDAVKECKHATFTRCLNLVPAREGARVLDCGCAAGYLCEVAQRQGFLPFGAEMNVVAARLAQEKFSASQIYAGTLESAPFPDGFFYALFMNDFLEHVRDPIAVLHKAHRLLEPGGYLMITTPNTGSFSSALTGRAWPHYKQEHLFYFNKKNIRMLLTQAGFSVSCVTKAYKCLTLDYIKAYFNKYPRKLHTFLFRGVDCLPPGIRFKKIWFAFGEMAVLAQK